MQKEFVDPAEGNERTSQPCRWWPRTWSAKSNHDGPLYDTCLDFLVWYPWLLNPLLQSTIPQVAVKVWSRCARCVGCSWGFAENSHTTPAPMRVNKHPADKRRPDRKAIIKSIKERHTLVSWLADLFLSSRDIHGNNHYLHFYFVFRRGDLVQASPNPPLSVDPVGLLRPTTTLSLAWILGSLFHKLSSVAKNRRPHYLRLFCDLGQAENPMIMIDHFRQIISHFLQRDRPFPETVYLIWRRVGFICQSRVEDTASSPAIREDRHDGVQLLWSFCRRKLVTC